MIKKKKKKKKEAAGSSDSFPSTTDSQRKAGMGAGAETVKETASGDNPCPFSCVALGHVWEVQL